VNIDELRYGEKHYEAISKAIFHKFVFWTSSYPITILEVGRFALSYCNFQSKSFCKENVAIVSA